MISFEQDDMSIVNPFLSPCGRFEVDPCATYGFERCSTGGGFVALAKQLPDGGHILVTGEDETVYPTTSKDAVIGLYDKDGVQVDYHYIEPAYCASCEDSMYSIEADQSGAYTVTAKWRKGASTSNAIDGLTLDDLNRLSVELDEFLKKQG